MIEIDVYTANYAPWEEDADEPERLDESSKTFTFDTAVDCADWLEREGFGWPSESGPYRFHTWLNELEPYQDPDTGSLTERWAHAGQATDARVWAAIVASVSIPYTNYHGPYYVERINAFGYKI
jgi:hypothetical protein